MKSIIKYLLAKAGYKLSRTAYYKKNFKEEYLSINSMQGALLRLKSLGIQPKVIVDVGAASGQWTRQSLNVWPNSIYHLIEPLEEQQTTLKELSHRFGNIRNHFGVAGSSRGFVSLTVSSDLDGSGVYGEQGENLRQVPVLTLDEITKDDTGQILIKLDTHGYEVQILEGAKNTLKLADVLIIEVYGFHVSPTALLFHQLSEYLERSEFRLFDIVDVMRRTKDNAFWQADAVYLRSDHSVFKDNKF